MLPFHVIQLSPAGATSWDAENAGAGETACRCPDAPTAASTLTSAANAARTTKRRSFIPLLLERCGTPRAYSPCTAADDRPGYEPVTTIGAGPIPSSHGALRLAPGGRRRPRDGGVRSAAADPAGRL